MADEVQYAGGADSTTPTHKRKYADDQAAAAMPSPIPSSGRRQTGFSAPISSTSPPDSNNNPPQPSYSSVPPPADDFLLAKQRAQEIAARLFNSSDPKRARVENGASAFDSAPIPEQKSLFSSSQIASAPSTIPVSYGGYQSTSKKIDIPNVRVGVIIGKGGETIKYLQIQSGAKIQVTRDNDADLNSATRLVELMGTQDQIAKAEELINGVLAEAEAGGSGIVSRRLTGQSGSDQFVMKVPNNKVGLIIGKGGETIKNMQTCTGARIQVIPLHLPPGDTSTERTLQIDGTSEQIEAAKQLVNEVISENRLRNPSMGGGYSQQGYQARPPTNWGNSAQQQMQQSGYGYVQPGAYPNPSPQYNMPPPAYSSYPTQPSSGYSSSGWDQSTVPPSQQTTPGSGYDYYSQQPSQQQPQGHNGPTPTDNSGYSYNQAQAAGYPQGQGYPQDAYGGGYHTAAPQPGYGQPSSVQGYEQQGYSSAPGYGNTTNPAQDGHSGSYGAQGENVQAPAPVQTPAMSQQQGYSTSQQPSPNPGAYPSQVASQQAYGMPPATHAGYGTQPPAQTGYGPGYGPPQAQKPTAQPPYGQAQQSPSTPGAYAQSGSVQSGYSHSQPPPAQTGYAQPDSATQRAPSSYGAAASQPGYGPPAYGTAPSPYGQQPPYNGASYGGGYSQPPAYSSDANAVPAPTAAPAQPKASPQS